uniref:Uncharacterized protein n=1 Tax=Athene cunicularia TaxID=194338 RepID=A0A663MA94_ATHCN
MQAPTVFPGLGRSWVAGGWVDPKFCQKSGFLSWGCKTSSHAALPFQLQSRAGWRRDPKHSQRCVVAHSHQWHRDCNHVPPPSGS